jgi:hypothetical protein
MVRIAVVVSTLLAVCGSASAGTFAGGAGNAARAACRDDAYRFCSAVIADAGKRRACMGQHLSQLSPGCRAAIGR